MAETVNIKKSYSALNESLTKLFDEAGVRRTFTVPYIEGQSAADHINSVGQVAAQSGGVTGNMITSAHHSAGKGYGSGDGHTVGHPTEKLRTTVIQKDDEHAKAAIAAAQKNINNLKFLLGGDEPSVQTAQSQLDLVKKTDGAGMNLFDFGGMLIQVMFRPMQAMARAHSQTHPDGPSPQLRVSKAEAAPTGQESPQEPQGDAQGGGAAPTDQPVAPEAAAAPQAAQVPPAGAPAAPQAQG